MMSYRLMIQGIVCVLTLAVGIVGRKTEVQTANEREIRLAAEAGRGSFTVLIASAASFDPKENIVAAALRQLAAAEGRGYAALVESNKRWWHDFWSKGYVELHSEDGVADTIEHNYTYYLYVMASSSRGKFPAKFNGMIWITGGDPPIWIRALPPVFRGRGEGRPDGNTMPQWFFDLCTLENDDPETMRIANATMDGYLRGPGTRPGVLSKVGVTAAMLGRADAVRYLLPNQLSFPDRAPILANRLDQREGTQTTNAQRLGRVADTLHNALLQSVGAGPAREPVIRVFPTWPRQWDAAFTLLARGAFLVGSSMKAGKIEFVRIESQAGGECRLRNPWPDATVTLHRDGNKAEDLAGEVLAFPTRKGETLVAVPKDSTMSPMDGL